MCHVNLDLRQRDMIERHNEVEETPMLYLTQLLGLALGLDGEELGLNALNISAAPLLQKLNASTVARQGADL
jgi:heterodisulfide reductase subunit B